MDLKSSVSRLRSAIHDVKNLLLILGGVLARLNAALEAGNIEEAKALTLRAQEQLDRTKRIAEDNKEKPEKVNIVSVVRDLVDTFKSRMSGVQLSFDLQSRDRFVDAPPTLIYRVLNNVIMNAVEAAKYGQRKFVRVAVYSQKAGWVSVLVFNDGGHIEQRDGSFEYIFEDGFSTKEGRRGSGLTVVKAGLIEMQGKLVIQNVVNPEFGVNFIITLKESL